MFSLSMQCCWVLCFHILVLMNRAAVNIQAQVFFQQTWFHPFEVRTWVDCLFVCLIWKSWRKQFLISVAWVLRIHINLARNYRVNVNTNALDDFPLFFLSNFGPLLSWRVWPSGKQPAVGLRGDLSVPLVRLQESHRQDFLGISSVPCEVGWSWLLFSITQSQL